MAGQIRMKVLGVRGGGRTGKAFDRASHRRFSDIEIAWMAGLLEGEGCFTAEGGQRARFRYPRITLGMTDRDVVERASVLFDARVQAPITHR